MLGCPKESDLVYNLYCGPKFSSPLPGYSCTTSIDSEPITPLAWKVNIDVAKIDGAILYSGFRPDGVTSMTSEARVRFEESKKDPPHALYKLPSLFNHSCHPNSVWRCFGDVMVIRAREAILPGTEITIPYNYETTWIEREKHLTPLIGEPCDCVLCISERTDGEDAYRLRQELVDDMKITGLAGSAAQACIKALISTYRSDQGLPRAPLFNAYMYAMGPMDCDAKRPTLLESSIRMGFKALEAAGFASIDTKLTGTKPSKRVLPISKECLATCLLDITACIILMARLSASFLALSEIGLAERWFRAAWWGKYTLYISPLDDWLIYIISTRSKLWWGPGIV